MFKCSYQQILKNIITNEVTNKFSKIKLPTIFFKNQLSTTLLMDFKKIKHFQIY